MNAMIHPGIASRLGRAAIGIALAANAEAFAAEPAWEKMPPLPEPDGGFVCGVVGGDLVIAGGTNWKADTKLWLDRIRVFETGARKWRDAGRLPAPCAYAAYGQMGDGVWFACGSSGAQSHTSLHRLGPDLRVTPIADLDLRSVSGASAVLDGELFVIGGTREQGRSEMMTNACHAVDLKTGRARRIADLPVPGFVSGAAAACDGRVIVFGGARWDAATKSVANLSSTLAWSPRQDCWEPLMPYPFAVRGLAAVSLDTHHIYLAGGYKNDAEEFTAEAFVFDARSGVFHRAPALPYRGMVTLVKCGDFLHCLGGEDSKKHRSDAHWRIPWRLLLPPHATTP